MTLGKYTTDADSYIVKAGNNSTYFDMGNEWNVIRQEYGLSDKEMFEIFNKTALYDAIASEKTIKFSHNPISLEDGGFLQLEWEYIKEMLNVTDNNLVKIGDFWYVK